MGRRATATRPRARRGRRSPRRLAGECTPAILAIPRSRRSREIDDCVARWLRAASRRARVVWLVIRSRCTRRHFSPPCFSRLGVRWHPGLLPPKDAHNHAAGSGCQGGVRPGRGGSLLSSAAVNGRGGCPRRCSSWRSCRRRRGVRRCRPSRPPRHPARRRRSGSSRSPGRARLRPALSALRRCRPGRHPARRLAAGPRRGMWQPVVPPAAQPAGVALEHPTPPPRG